MISIVTPCYNAEHTISETIESVIAQTYTDWELLVVDDCSTDKSAEIIKNFQLKDDRIKYFKLEVNSKVAAARNFGVTKAKGEYIAFVDSDDLWLPEKLAIQVDTLNTHNTAICCTSFLRMDDNGKNLNQIISVPNSLSFYKYLKTTPIGFSTLLIDRSKIEIPTFVTMKLHEDMLFICHLYDQVKEIVGIEKPLMRYRVQKESLSSNKIKAAKQVFFIYRHYLKFNILKSVFLFTNYALNSVLKRFL